jgi:inorganic pyrophosphatase
MPVTDTRRGKHGHPFARGADMNLLRLPARTEDGAIHVVVESPRGSAVKLKYDGDLEAFTLSRPLVEGIVYPCDWGFVPSTCAPDGDPLDAMVVWDRSTFPGILLTCRMIGVLGVEQNSKRHPGQRERNDRIIAVPIGSPRHSEVRTVDDLSDRLKTEIEAFFLASTALEHKDLKFMGWSGIEAAERLISSSRAKATKS